MKMSDVRAGMILKNTRTRNVISVTEINSEGFKYAWMGNPYVMVLNGPDRELDGYELLSVDPNVAYADPPLGGGTGSVIAARQSTHGVFKDNTVYMQAAKDLMRDQPNWKTMPEYMREALDMFAHKQGRILHGDPSYLDHWEDIAGYAQRVVKTIKGDLSP